MLPKRGIKLPNQPQSFRVEKGFVCRSAQHCKNHIKPGLASNNGEMGHQQNDGDGDVDSDGQQIMKNLSKITLKLSSIFASEQEVQGLARIFAGGDEFQ